MKSILPVVLLLLVGCASADLSRGIYEGARQHRASQADPNTPRPAQPDYDAYQKERDRLKAAPEEQR